MAAAGKYMNVVRGTRWAHDVAKCGKEADSAQATPSLHIIFARLTEKPDRVSLLRISSGAFPPKEYEYWNSIFNLEINEQSHAPKIDTR